MLNDYAPDNLGNIFGVVSNTATDLFLNGGANIDECGCPSVANCVTHLNLTGCQATGDNVLCSIACYSENAVNPDFKIQEALLEQAGFATQKIRNSVLFILAAAARGRSFGPYFSS